MTRTPPQSPGGAAGGGASFDGLTSDLGASTVGGDTSASAQVRLTRLQEYVKHYGDVFVSGKRSVPMSTQLLRIFQERLATLESLAVLRKGRFKQDPNHARDLRRIQRLATCLANSKALKLTGGRPSSAAVHRGSVRMSISAASGSAKFATPPATPRDAPAAPETAEIDLSIFRSLERLQLTDCCSARLVNVPPTLQQVRLIRSSVPFADLVAQGSRLRMIWADASPSPDLAAGLAAAAGDLEVLALDATIGEHTDPPLGLEVLGGAASSPAGGGWFGVPVNADAPSFCNTSSAVALCSARPPWQRLTELRAQHNGLAAHQLAPAALRHLPMLRALDLSHNAISLGAAGAAGAEGLGMLRGLTALNLSNNGIEEIPPGVLPTGLQELVLDGNKLSSVAAIRGLDQLQSLSLRGNALSNWPDTVQLVSSLEGRLLKLALEDNRDLLKQLRREDYRPFVAGIIAPKNRRKFSLDGIPLSEKDLDASRLSRVSVTYKAYYPRRRLAPTASGQLCFFCSQSGRRDPEAPPCRCGNPRRVPILNVRSQEGKSECAVSPEETPSPKGSGEAHSSKAGSSPPGSPASGSRTPMRRELIEEAFSAMLIAAGGAVLDPSAPQAVSRAVAAQVVRSDAGVQQLLCHAGFTSSDVAGLRVFEELFPQSSGSTSIDLEAFIAELERCRPQQRRGGWFMSKPRANARDQYLRQVRQNPDYWLDDVRLQHVPPRPKTRREVRLVRKPIIRRVPRPRTRSPSPRPAAVGFSVSPPGHAISVSPASNAQSPPGSPAVSASHGSAALLSPKHRSPRPRRSPMRRQWPGGAASMEPDSRPAERQESHLYREELTLDSEFVVESTSRSWRTFVSFAADEIGDEEPVIQRIEPDDGTWGWRPGPSGRMPFQVAVREGGEGAAAPADVHMVAVHEHLSKGARWIVVSVRHGLPTAGLDGAAAEIDGPTKSPAAGPGTTPVPCSPPEGQAAFSSAHSARSDAPTPRSPQRGALPEAPPDFTTVHVEVFPGAEVAESVQTAVRLANVCSHEPGEQLPWRPKDVVADEQAKSQANVTTVRGITYLSRALQAALKGSHHQASQPELLIGFRVPSAEAASTLLSVLRDRFTDCRAKPEWPVVPERAVQAAPLDGGAAGELSTRGNPGIVEFTFAAPPFADELEQEQADGFGLSVLRLGGIGIDTSDLYMHFKLKIAGKRIPDERLLEAHNIEVGLHICPADEGPTQAKAGAEQFVGCCYVNALLGGGEASEECSIAMMFSDSHTYMVLDANWDKRNPPPKMMSTQARVGVYKDEEAYFLFLNCHRSRDLDRIDVGYELQYLRLTYGGDAGQTYLLLPRCQRSALYLLRMLIQQAGTNKAETGRVIVHASPFARRALSSAGEVCGYFLCFINRDQLRRGGAASKAKSTPDILMARALDRARALSRRPTTISRAPALSMLDTMDFPQEVYPLRELPEQVTMLPVTLVITEHEAVLVTDCYGSWPDNEGSPARWHQEKKESLSELQVIATPPGEARGEGEKRPEPGEPQGEKRKRRGRAASISGAPFPTQFRLDFRARSGARERWHLCAQTPFALDDIVGVLMERCKAIGNGAVREDDLTPARRDDSTPQSRPLPTPQTRALNPGLLTVRERALSDASSRAVSQRNPSMASSSRRSN